MRFRTLKINCKCGDTKRFILERREIDRVPAKLPRVFYHIASGGQPDFHDMNTVDISTRGMCFHAADNSDSKPSAGNTILILFKPHSTANSFIKKEAFIKNFKDNNFHVEFSKSRNLSDDLPLKILRSYNPK